ncbi:ComEC/Rec2 family competence protein [Helicobacter sp. 23-1048]
MVLDSLKEWIVALCALLVIFFINVGLQYSHYTRYYESHTEPKEIYGRVIAQYTKNSPKGTSYEVLKIQTQDGASIYTTSKEDIKDLQHSFVRLWGKSAKCEFWQYLRSCYFFSFSISVESKKDYRDSLREFILSQHTDSLMGELYKTLYIADFLPKSLRDVANTLGIAHVIAISGFHLGILSLGFGILLHFLYKRVHRFFPYRNRFYDVGAIVVALLFGYLVLLDFSASFLRAWVMAFIGFFLAFMGARILQFRFLAFIGLVCIAFFPRLLFSVGFFLSFFGVFYIYLFMHHCKELGNLARRDYVAKSKDSLICAYFFHHFWTHKFYVLVLLPVFFNAVIFVNMLILVHFFFPYFSVYTIASIPITIGFTLFFPASIIAHCLSVGNVFDDFLVWLFSLDLQAVEVFSSAPIFFGYLILSIFAIRFRVAYIALNGVGVLFLVWLYYNALG